MTTDHTADTCTYSWCTAHATACECAYSDQFPHVARGCRYAPEQDAVTKQAGTASNACSADATCQRARTHVVGTPRWVAPHGRQS